MALTRLDILNQASELIQDPNHDLFAGGVSAKNDAINRVQRYILLRSELNRAHIIVEFPGPAVDGTVEFNTHTSVPTITYKDMDGWPTWKVSDLYKMDELERWLTTSDDRRIKILPVTIEDVHRLGLLEAGDEPISHYRLVLHNIFQFYPKIADADYPWKVKIPYRKLATDMAADGDTPSMPEGFEDILIYASAAEWLYQKERPDLAAPWESRVLEMTGVSIQDQHQMSNDKATDIQRTWGPMY